MENIQDYFENRDTIEIAKDMLGHSFTYQTENGIVSGLIVETEAYLGEIDKAAHSYNGRHTKANDPLYQSGGTIYIYSIHSWLDMDISIQKAGIPNGILIRGIQPLTGLEIMEKNRKKTGFEVSNGPAKWMRAFGIMDKELSGTMLNTGKFNFSEQKIQDPANILATPRIGVPNKEPWTSKKMRFIVEGNPYVSKLPKREMNLETFGWL